MRELKFRGWDNEEMVYWEPFKYYDNSFIEPRTIFEETIMQYIGLKDKNGKEIYEGDIVENNINKKRWEVLFGDYSYIFATNRTNQIPMWGDWAEEYFFYDYINILKKSKSQIEIIGNIYENPELLNKK